MLDWQSLGACCRPDSQHPFSVSGQTLATLRFDPDASAEMPPGGAAYELRFEHEGRWYGGIVGSPEFRGMLEVPAPETIPCGHGCVSRLVRTPTGFVVTYVAGSPHGAIVEFTGRARRASPGDAGR